MRTICHAKSWTIHWSWQHLSQVVTDVWWWNADLSVVYSIRSAYNIIHFSTEMQEDEAYRILWKSAAPLKAIALGWRVIINKVPAKVSLVRRGISLDPQDILYVFCKDFDESANHLFFACKEAYGAWQMVYSWLGFHSVLPANGASHFMQHVHHMRNNKLKKFWTDIWITGVWCI